MIEPVPLQDIQRVKSSANVDVLTGPELRTIFLGFDQIRDELLFSNVKGKNPFKDIRVRKAFYYGIDIETIKSRVMRGLSTTARIRRPSAVYRKSTVSPIATSAAASMVAIWSPSRSKSKTW